MDLASPHLTFDDLRIIDVKRRLLTFEPMLVQQSYLDILLPNWRTDQTLPGGLREIILKARKEGFSTLIGALFFLDTINHPNTRTVVIAHRGDSSEKLFRMVRLMYKSLPPEKQPRTDYQNKRMLSFPDLNSEYSVLTAGADEVGRADTINNLHMSEMAFWRNRDLITGLIQALPAEANCFIESTAKGQGNQYHETWEAAKAGKSTFAPRFFAWFEHETNTLTPPEGWRPTDEHSPKDDLSMWGNEAELATAHHLTPEQLYWRNRKIMEPGMGSLFPQEHPATPEEAFLVSGQTFFKRWDPKLGGRHVVQSRDIPKHWEFRGGLDWGYESPFCFQLDAIDEQGGVWVVDEIYMPGLEDREMADRVCRCLERHGLDKRKVMIAADPAMWAKKKQGGHIGKANIEAFQSAGLWVVPGEVSPISRDSNFRQYLADDDAFHVLDGRAPNLCREMPLQKHGDGQRVEYRAEKDEHKRPIDDHAVDAQEYLLNTRIRKAKPAPPEQQTHPPNIKPELILSKEELAKQMKKFGVSLPTPRETW